MLSISAAATMNSKTCVGVCAKRVLIFAGRLTQAPLQTHPMRLGNFILAVMFKLTVLDSD